MFLDLIIFTGVMQAKMNNGAEDRPNSHLHPSVGATANASATSKQAPNAQKHCKFNQLYSLIDSILRTIVFYHTHI